MSAIIGNPEVLPSDDAIEAERQRAIRERAFPLLLAVALDIRLRVGLGHVCDWQNPPPVPCIRCALDAAIAAAEGR